MNGSFSLISFYEILYMVSMLAFCYGILLCPLGRNDYVSPFFSEGKGNHSFLQSIPMLSSPEVLVSADSIPYMLGPVGPL